MTEATQTPKYLDILSTTPMQESIEWHPLDESNQYTTKVLAPCPSLEMTRFALQAEEPAFHSARENVGRDSPRHMSVDTARCCRKKSASPLLSMANSGPDEFVGHGKNGPGSAALKEWTGIKKVETKLQMRKTRNGSDARLQLPIDGMHLCEEFGSLRNDHRRRLKTSAVSLDKRSENVGNGGDEDSQGTPSCKHHYHYYTFKAPCSFFPSDEYPLVDGIFEATNESTSVQKSI